MNDPFSYKSPTDIEACQSYNLNYSLAATIGFERSVEELNRNESNLVSCTRREFDSQEALTVVSKV